MNKLAEDLRDIIRVMAVKPGFYFCKKENLMDRYQAFFAGFNFALTVNACELYEWNSLIHEFERWYSMTRLGTSNSVGWFDHLLNENKHDQAKSFDHLMALLQEFLEVKLAVNDSSKDA